MISVQYYKCYFTFLGGSLFSGHSVYMYTLWPHYSGKCRTVGTYSPRRNHGRATESRQTEKTVDTRHWRVDWLRIHSAIGDVTRSSTMEKKRKILQWSSAVAKPHQGRSTSEWVSEWVYKYILLILTLNIAQSSMSTTKLYLLAHAFHIVLLEYFIKRLNGTQWLLHRHQ